MINTFTISTFDEGEVFVVYIGEPNVELVLEKVISGISKMPGANREPFSLIFRGSKSLPLLQGCYQMEHTTIGVFDIFIVPVMPNGMNCNFSYYEACFS